MKRKIFLVTLGILIFTCLFVVTAFATVDYNETATLADGTTLPIYDENHNPLIWYVSGTDASGNNVYSSVPNNRNEPNENNDTYVTYVSSTGTWAQLNDIYIHTYDTEKGEYVSTIDDELQIVVLNLREFDMIYLGAINADYIQYMYYPATLKDCPEKFKGKTAIRLVDMSVCNMLVGGFGGTQNFSGCTNLHTVRLPIGPEYTFEGKNNWKFKNTAISSIVIPEAVTSIGTDNFYGCKNLVSIYILGNETSLGQRNFENCANLTNIYILGDNPTIDITSFKENFIECEGKDFRSIGKYFLFATTNIEYLNSVKDAIEATAIISYSDYIANAEDYTEGRYIISGTSICDVYYGAHELDENNSNSCAGICTVCGKAVMSSSPVHNYKTTIEYSSYLEFGIKTQACQNSGCVHNVTPLVTESPSLFVCKGYSASKTGVDGIALGFEVNNKAIDEYETITGKTLNYGVFAVSQANLDASDIFDKNGNAIKGAITADLTTYEFETFEIKVVGFLDTQKSLPLAMGAYVKVTDDENTDYSYLQFGTPKENEKFSFVSYNDIVK
ncbi:MAG: leucine-rich repeat domain-containing protein [Clostridia bacterium]|nr:leucine-rich repeat domain-containing protein [Clostridia bacterium]